MKKLRIDIENNETRNICKQCEGDCCKAGPGLYHPSDFNYDPKIMKDRLRTERICVDWWEGDPRVKSFADREEGHLSVTYFIRPSYKGQENRKRHPGWGGECTFLKLRGCSLLFEKRPLNCRILEAKKKIRDKNAIVTGYWTKEMEEENKCKIPGYKNTTDYKRDLVIEWIPFQDVIEKILLNIEED